MREIAQAAWECADPGMQKDTTINEGTCPATGRINASNPCSEYMHLDNSGSNLVPNSTGQSSSTTQHLRRQVPQGRRGRVHGPGDHRPGRLPDQKIGANARAFRQLGLGYANLGALLMARGLPYDSDGGRAGRRDHRADDRAGVPDQRPDRRGDGAVRGVRAERRRDASVMRKHRAAADEIDGEAVPEALLSAAKQSWDDAIAFGAKHGFRNSQATVLAPTGTIGLMMDCDTTGIEPELALVKTKKLVGGGTMQFVNQTVPRARPAGV